MTPYPSVSLNCRDQPQMVVFMTVIVVAFTVVINGITMAPMMKLLKMTDLTPARKMQASHARASAVSPAVARRPCPLFPALSSDGPPPSRRRPTARTPRCARRRRSR